MYVAKEHLEGLAGSLTDAGYPALLSVYYTRKRMVSGYPTHNAVPLLWAFEEMCQTPRKLRI